METLETFVQESYDEKSIQGRKSKYTVVITPSHYAIPSHCAPCLSVYSLPTAAPRADAALIESLQTFS